MKDIQWNALKSERLKRTRGISFEDLLQSKLIAVMQHPKRTQQNILLFEHQKYVWVVPYIESGSEIFLKTLYPSRKYTKMYKKGKF